MIYFNMTNRTHYLVICLTTLFICALSLINAFKNKSLFRGNHKEFIALIISTMLAGIFDYLMWNFDNTSHKGLLIFSTLGYYVCEVLPLFLWFIYILRRYVDEKKFKKYFIYAFIPMIVEIVLSIVSLFTGVFYNIYEVSEGIYAYERGKLVWILISVLLFYGVMDFILIFIVKKRIGRREFLAYMLTPLLVIIAGVIQALFYGVDSYILSVAIMTLASLIGILKEALMTDFLTTLYNRRRLVEYLEVDITRKQFRLGKKYLVGVMLDLDKFKSINDRFGHTVGDEALSEAAQILKLSFNKDDFVSRYAGDEFVAIVLTNNENKAEEIKNSIIRTETKWANDNIDKPYKLNFSIGSFLFDLNEPFDFQGFLERIDKEMYHDKNLHATKLIDD